MLRLDRPLLRLSLVVVVSLALVVPLEAATRKKHRSKKGKGPRPTPTMAPLQGPPAPTPVPELRAAGACLEYEPGHFLLLAEVGAKGTTFRIDKSTEIETAVRKGIRLRVLYVEGPEGPVARRILPGPIAATPVPPGPKGPKAPSTTPRGPA